MSKIFEEKNCQKREMSQENDDNAVTSLTIPLNICHGQ